MDTENKIENLLRKAPAPAAPPGLEESLIRQISLPRAATRAGWSWMNLFQQRSWVPAACSILVLVGVLAVLAMQQATLSDLREKNAELVTEVTGRNNPGAGATDQQRTEALTRELEELRKQSVELNALRAEMSQLEQATASAQALVAENQKLQAEITKSIASAPGSSAEETAELALARDRANRIKCVNNLKNIGLAARIWGTDNSDVLPVDFITMKNELSTPKILICPSDPNRQTAPNWETFTAANNSYEMLSPGIAESKPQAVYARCPIHNNVALADGSVHQLSGNRQVVMENGILVIKNAQ
jgi:hypothetical protein